MQDSMHIGTNHQSVIARGCNCQLVELFCCVCSPVGSPHLEFCHITNIIIFIIIILPSRNDVCQFHQLDSVIVAVQSVVPKRFTIVSPLPQPALFFCRQHLQHMSKRVVVGGDIVVVVFKEKPFCACLQRCDL